ncbi:MAG: glutathione S-transferase family protein [Rhodospirillaceae bacterium]|nr:glutathione S-transferase family protein [Rhodospirillaceae bacterium]
MIKFYDAALSGNCHKVRMLLSMLQIPHEVVPISLPNMDHKTPAHIARNPLGTVPVIEDGDVVIYDSQAILVYLAAKHGGDQKDNLWLPGEPSEQALVQQWLSFAVNEIWNGPALARAFLLFDRDVDLARCQAAGKAALSILEGRLRQHDWLALDHPTIADIACYPYSALSEAGEISLAPYEAVRAWFKRIEALPGYVSMPGLGD